VAESESGQDKTEEATPKRQEKAKEEGQVARSRELTTLFVLFAGVGGLLMFGGGLGSALLDQMRFNFALPREVAFDTALAVAHLGRSVLAAGFALLPLFALLMLAALAGPVAMGGWLFSGKAVMFKGSRINPLQGVKRMFSAHALAELFKALAKFLLLGGIAITVVASLQQSLLALGLQALEPAFATALRTAGWAVLAVSCGMILIAAVDVPFQLFQHKRKLKMTMQEVRDEMKDTEGKPEVKGRIRQLQREMARRRMMEAVPQADVIITNPDHFSVALRYDPAKGGAPVLVAKGVDQVALKIREIANAHGVQLLPAPPLARAIYYTTELEQEIPGPLYLAVAQVLAHVFQLKAYRQGEGQKPKPLDEFELPAEMRYDARGKRAGY
jgi:flagellar biosynthetic protein FlhB